MEGLVLIFYLPNLIFREMAIDIGKDSNKLKYLQSAF
jgi:hypothetical protein